MLKNPFYKGCIFTIVIFSMILGLQLISFNTTHAGADYYMRNIKKWAPVMFAAAVQGTIVLLSVFRFDSPRHERRRLRFLGAAVVISIAFSYVGIINGTIDPLAAYEPSKQNYEVVFNETNAQAFERFVAHGGCPGGALRLKRRGDEGNGADGRG